MPHRSTAAARARRALPILRALPVILGTTALLASCSSPVVTEPAPSASDPVCARVLQFSPATIDGYEARATTSQASLAWGTPPITLRCGVPPLPPTGDPCMTLTDEDGLAVDWVVVEHESDLGPTTFMTYGRVPAVEVSVPSGYSLTAASGLLLDLADAVSRTEVQRSCL